MTTSILERPATKLSFSGHETFPFRYTWLKKAIDCVSADPFLFRREDALVKLGVGKNMVDSIKYWAITLQVVRDLPSSKGEQGGCQVTELGKKLFADKGWDPYLEDTATLWLLHWLLASEKTRASTWFYAFNKLASVEFTKEQLSAELLEFAQQNNTRLTPNTLSRDIDCFIRTYVPSKSVSTAALLEDTLDCPLVELELVFEAGQKGMFVFSRGDKKGLPDEVLVYALLDYWRKVKPHGEVLSMEELVYGEASLGLIFKIDEDSLMRRFEKLARLTNNQLAFDETSGLRQVYKRAATPEPEEFLQRYFDHKI